MSLSTRIAAGQRISVAAPSHKDMVMVLNHVAKRAGTGSLPKDVVDEIITDANGNMRKQY